MTESEHWISAHLYFDGDLFDAGCDRMIRRIIRPLVRALRKDDVVHRAFFVRYTDPLPHIRLRLLVAHADAERSAMQAVEQSWRPHNDKAASRTRRRAVHWTSYERETGRYGGLKAMPIVEQLFDASSQLAFRLLTPAVSTDRAERLGRATVASLVFMHPFLGAHDGVSRFAREHGPRWNRLHTTADIPALQLRQAKRAAIREAKLKRGTIAGVLNYLDTNGTLPPTLEEFRRAVIVARTELERLVHGRQMMVHDAVAANWGVASTALTVSLLHMTCNRLGVTRLEELQLSHLLKECLSA